VMANNGKLSTATVVGFGHQSSNIRDFMFTVIFNIIETHNATSHHCVAHI